MKYLFAALLCFFLCGCTRETAATEPAVSETQTAVSTGMYDPSHPMEQAYPGEVRGYPLTLRKVQGLRSWGNSVLAFSGQGSTTLTVLSGDNLQETASCTLDFNLAQDDPSLQIHEESISFFDPQKQETLVLDRKLQEVRRIAAPPQLSGSPILSADQSTLFYCTSQAVMAWNLETGIRRTVKELSFQSQELTALHWGDTVLQCCVQEEGISKTLLLSGDTGMELQSLSEDAWLTTKENRYFAAIPGGNQTLLVFGGENRAASLLIPERIPQQQFYLPEDHAAVTVHASKSEILLDYYELSTGILRRTLALEPLHTPKAIVNSKGHSIYILCYDPAKDCDILYRWDVLRQPPDASNVTDHTAAYYSEDAPDLAALEQCREYARRIGEKYGITVAVWEEAVSIQPWDYRFEPEYLAPILQKELTLLDQRLAQYPAEILEQTASHFTALTIRLVRQITGTTDSGSLSTATGIQFFDGTDAHVVITVGKYSEQALYHELFHVMETHILTNSTALDSWNGLNPPGFSYDNGYNPGRDSGIYLQGDTRAFVDTYSMSFPKEDRARILEYAILPGNQDLFLPNAMQQKLTAICTGIRDAYGLKKSEDAFLWEQYLKKPLSPGA